MAKTSLLLSLALVTIFGQFLQHTLAQQKVIRCFIDLHLSFNSLVHCVIDDFLKVPSCNTFKKYTAWQGFLVVSIRPNLWTGKYQKHIALPASEALV